MPASLLRWLERLEMRIRLLVSRCVLNLIDDTQLMQRVQIQMQGDTPYDGVEHFQPYGLTAKPKAGAEGIFLRVGGAGEQGIVICIADRRYELKGLEDGEIALHDDQGQFVKVARDKISLKATTLIELDAPTVVAKHALHVEEDVIADGDVSDASGTAQTMADMRTTYNAHTHASTAGFSPGGTLVHVGPPDTPPM